MKKILSLFLTVSLVVTLLCGVFPYSALGAEGAKDDVLTMEDGTVYKKLKIKTCPAYGGKDAEGKDILSSEKLYDGDYNTGYTYTKLSSVVPYFEEADMVRMYYSSTFNCKPSAKVNGKVYYSSGVIVTNETKYTDVSFPRGKTRAELNFGGDSTFNDPTKKLTIYEIEVYKKLSLSVSKANIENGATDVTNINGREPLSVEFSEAIDTTTVTGDNVKFTDGNENIVAPSLVSSGNVKVLKFDLKDLKPHTAYTFEMNTKVKSVDGAALDEPYSLTFTTGDIACCPYNENRVIREITDFTTQIESSKDKTYHEYSFDFKRAVPVSAVSIKLNEAKTGNSNFGVRVCSNGALKVDYKDCGKLSVNNETTDVQNFYLNAGKYRFLWFSGNFDINNIEYIKVYSSVEEKLVIDGKVYKKAVVRSNPLIYGAFNGGYEYNTVDTKKLFDEDLETSYPYTKIASIVANSDDNVNLIRIYCSGTKTNTLSVPFVNGKFIKQLKVSGERTYTDFALDAPSKKFTLTFGGNEGSLGNAPLTIYEIEFYTLLDDSAKFVSASSSTNDIVANELAKAYDNDVNTYCDVNAKDIILKLEKPTIASAIKIGYVDDMAGSGEYSVCVAATNDDSAYEEVSKFNFLGLTETVADTGVMEFPEKLVRYIKIERPESGAIKIADVKVYSENALPAAPEGQHWENIMAGLKPSAITPVANTGSTVDLSTLYRLTDGKFVEATKLTQTASAENTGANKSGAQYDIDLGAPYTIGGANMGWIDKNTEMSGCFALYGSADGETYTKLTELVTGLKNDSGVITATFSQGEYRYLRLVKGVKTPASFNKSTGVLCGHGYADSADITELEIYGLVPNSTGLVISNNAFEKVGNGYNWSVSLRNYTGERKTYIAFAACYDAENSLLNCVKIGPVTSDDFDYGKIINIYAPATMVPSNTKLIKTFLWDGSGNAQPIMKFNELEVIAK